MKFISLFSGIGGFDLAFERADMVCDTVCEIDKDAQKVLRRHFPDAKLYDDVHQIGVATHERKSVDLICGGFPCQDVSIAGKRAGLAGERSGLWSEFARIVEELAPRWVLIENVPGLLSVCGCAACGAVRRLLKIHKYLRRKCKINKPCPICVAGKRMLKSHRGRDFAGIIQRLVECGYGVAWRVLDAQYFGVPQRRRRVFVVGSLGDGRAAQVLFETGSLSGDTSPRRNSGEEVAYSLRANSKGSLGNSDGEINTTMIASTISTRPNRNATDQDYIIGPLQAHSKKHGHAMTTQQAAESGQLLTFGWNKSSSQTMKISETTDALQASPTSNPAIWEMSHADEVIRDNGEIFPTLQARMGTGGNQVPMVGVRRLMPVECERLQGFPDKFTDGQSDSARYRQLGNAVAVPVVSWLAQRIKANASR